jgi:hypothetical protein
MICDHSDSWALAGDFLCGKGGRLYHLDPNCAWLLDPLLKLALPSGLVSNFLWHICNDNLPKLTHSAKGWKHATWGEPEANYLCFPTKLQFYQLSSSHQWPVVALLTFVYAPEHPGWLELSLPCFFLSGIALLHPYMYHLPFWVILDVIPQHQSRIDVLHRLKFTETRSGFWCY